MTDFGESFTECEQAEPDFGELAMKLRESREDCTEGATGSVSISPSPPVRCLEQESSDYLGPKHPPVPPDVVECLDQQMTITQICSEQHIDEVSQQLYKVLYGYIVDQTDLDADTLKPVKPVEFYKKTIQATLEFDLGAQGFSRTSKTKGDEQNLNSVAPSHASFMSHPDNANQALKDYSDTNDTKNLTPTTFVLMSHDSVVDALKENAGPHVQTSGLDYTIDIPLAPRVNEEAMLAHREVACRALTPESKVFKYKSQSPELTSEDHFYIASHNPSSSLEFVMPSESSRVVSCDSPTHLDLPCSLDTTIILTERMSSSPDSWSLYHELNFLTPDSPLPQIRPLSPLPPPIPQLDMGDMCAVPQGPAYISSAQPSVLQAAETGERPLTPMVSNRRPFGRPISPRSEISSGGSISPRSLYHELNFLTPDSPLDIEDRASSPGSVVSETDSKLRSSEVGFDDRCSSLESVASLTAHSQLSPDPLIPHFGHGVLHSATLCRSTSSSPKSLSSNMEPKGVHFMLIFSDDRPSSPESLASLNEHKRLFCEDVPSDNEFHLTKLESTSNEYRPGSPKLLTVGENQPPSQIEQLLVDDDWVLVSVCEAGERPVSPESKADCGSMSFSVAREIGALPTETAVCCPQLSDSTLQVPHNDPLEPNAFTIKATLLPEHIGENTSLPLCSTGGLSMSPHSSVPELEVEISLNVLKVCESPSPKLGFWGTGSAQAVYQSCSSVEQSTEVSLLVETSFRKSVIKKQSGEPPTSDIEAKYFEAQTQTLNTTPTEGTEPHQFQPLDVSQSEKDEMSSSLFATNSEIKLLPSAVIAEFPQVQVKASESPAHRAQTEVEGAEYSLMYDVELWKLISQVHDPQYVGDTCNKIATFIYAPTYSDDAVAQHRVIDDRQASKEQKSEARPFLPDSLPELNPQPPCPIQLLTHMRGRSPESSANKLRPLSPDLPIDRYRQSDLIALVTDYRSAQGSGISLARSDKEDHIKIPAIPPANRPSSPESTASVNEFMAPDSCIPETEYIQVQAGVEKVDEAGLLFESRGGALERSSLPYSKSEHNSPHYTLRLIPTIKLDSQHYLGNQHTLSPILTSSVHVAHPSQYRPNSPDVTSENKCETLWHLRYGPDPSIPPIVPESMGSSLESALSSVDCGNEDLIFSKPGDREGLLMNAPTYKATQVPFYRLVYDAELWKLISQIRDPQYVGEMHMGKTGLFQYATSSSAELFTTNAEKEDLCKVSIVHDRSVSTGSIISEISERPRSAESASEYRAMSPEIEDLRASSAESIVSLGKALSQDPPLPQYTHQIESAVFREGSRPSSSVSVASDFELEVFETPFFSVRVRSFSSDSIGFENEYRVLTPDSPIPDFGHTILQQTASIAEKRSPSPESLGSCMNNGVVPLTSLLYEVRPPSPESVISVNECRDLSSSPQSLSSDRDMETESLFSLSFDERFSSPESVASVSKYRRLSPDSPVPEFRQSLPESYRGISCPRSLSPESVASDVEYSSSICQMCEFENRPDSPESVSSVNEYRRLSPDSPLPHYTQCSNDKARVWYRSTSSEPIDPENDLETDICPPWFFEDRPVSPDTSASGALSPDSPIPEFRQMLVDISSHVEYRSYSPQSLSSDWDMETNWHSTMLFDEDRPLSSESDAAFRYRLSPDLLLPEFSNTKTKPIPSIVRQRSTSPESIGSDLECGAVSLPLLCHEDRPSSPVSYVSGHVHIPLSPASPISAHVIRSFETVDKYRDLRSISPESIVSDVEYNLINRLRPLSPHPTLPEFKKESPECVTLLRSNSSSQEITVAPDINDSPLGLDRPVSPQSDTECRSVSVDSAMHMVYERASSPDSMPEFNENRSLSPKSAIPAFPESLVEYPMTWATHGSSSPGSSDSECEVVVTSSRNPEVERRPSSPESISSVHKFAPLLPDSPVPEFMRILSSYFKEMPHSYRSCSSISPVSLSSDSEFVALPIQCWIGDTPRPLTPQSVDSEEKTEFHCEGPNKLVSEAQLLTPVTSVAQPDQQPFKMSKMHTTSREAELDLRLSKNDCCKVTRSESVTVCVYEEWIQHGSEQPESVQIVQSNIHEQNMGNIHEEIQPQPSVDQDLLEMGEKVQHPSDGELKDTTQGSAMAWPHRSEKTPLDIEDKESSKWLSIPSKAEEPNNFDVPFTEQMKSFTAKPEMISSLKLPDWNSPTTHRAVTPVLPEKTLLKSDKSHLFSDRESSPTEAQFSEQFSPQPDYEAVFSRCQTCSPVSLNDLSSDSPVFSFSDHSATESTIQEESDTFKDFEFSPGFHKVFSEFETTLSAFESVKKHVLPREPFKGAESLDSDAEFFDCKQALSDFSEVEDVNSACGIACHISEPPSPMPGSSPGLGFLKASPEYTLQPYLRVQDYKRVSSGSESIGNFAYDSDGLKEYRSEGDLLLCQEFPSRDQAEYEEDDDDDILAREISEELGALSSDSAEEEVLTTRVVHCRVIIQGDDLPEIPPQMVTEEKYTDEHGNIVVKNTTRKVIRKYVSADGVERQEVSVDGAEQENLRVQEGDVFSRVVKRTVVRSHGDQKECTISELLALGAASSSQFETEPVQGRKVSRVVKTTVVRGDRVEKHTGDASLTADLPSAGDDFKKALDYAGGFGKTLLLPHLVEQETLQEDGSVCRRTQMHKSRTQMRTVARDGQGKKHVHLERLEDATDPPRPDTLQQHLSLLLQHYCGDQMHPGWEAEGEGGEERYEKAEEDDPNESCD
ncbi:unnamed protein product [Merluccius merluccius]